MCNYTLMCLSVHTKEMTLFAFCELLFIYPHSQLLFFLFRATYICKHLVGKERSVYIFRKLHILFVLSLVYSSEVRIFYSPTFLCMFLIRVNNCMHTTYLFFLPYNTKHSLCPTTHTTWLLKKTNYFLHICVCDMYSNSLNVIYVHFR